MKADSMLISMRHGIRLLESARKRLREPLLRMWRPQLPIVEAVVPCKYMLTLSEQGAAALELAKIERNINARHLGALLGLPDNASGQLIRRLEGAGCLERKDNQFRYSENADRQKSGELAVLFDGLTGSACLAGLQGSLLRTPFRSPGCIEIQQRRDPDPTMLQDILRSTATAKRLYGIPENLTAIAKNLDSHTMMFADTLLIQTISNERHLTADNCSYFFDAAHPLVVSPKMFHIDDDIRRARSLLEEELAELGVDSFSVQQSELGFAISGAKSLAQELNSDTAWFPHSGIIAKLAV
ncbi:MAG: hypothetical protein KDD66_14095 [Bdellovibrionales bacterium]|nr:hypothetical protein [Bdellovibrionales bacterium]